MNCIEVRKATDEQLPFTKGTIYKWHSLKRYPAMIFKVAGKLVFDLDEWEEMLKKAKSDNVRKVSKIKKGLS